MTDAREVAGRLTKDDPYLIDYLKGWWGIGPSQPWGAAMSFCLEVAHGYGLIASESDTTPTPLGLEVRRILMEQDHD